MIPLAFVVLAVSVGVVLAALDGPYPRDQARIERASLLIVTACAATTVAGGALVLRGLLLG